MIDPLLQTYVSELHTESDFFAKLRQDHGTYPISKKETAAFLLNMMAIIRPKRILEIGTCIGYSAMLMASTDPDITITTIDRYQPMIDKAKHHFFTYGYDNRVTLIEESALCALENMDETQGQYDFIYLDAAKGQYINFLPHLVRLLKTGGTLIADNVLQDGTVANPWELIEKRQRTIYNNMRRYLTLITNTPGLTSSVLTVGDGLAVTTKTQEDIQLAN